jgi:hypothetical protein
LTGPRLEGSTHGYTSWQCTERRCTPSTYAWHRPGRLKYCRRRLRLTPHTLVDSARKNPAGAPTLLQGFRGYTHGCASTPPRNCTASRREECPISKRQPLRDPNGYHHRGSGATVGDSPRVPVGVLTRQTYPGGTRGSRFCSEDRDRETKNSKVCTRTRDTRFIQVRAARVANPTSCLGIMYGALRLVLVEIRCPARYLALLYIVQGVGS